MEEALAIKTKEKLTYQEAKQKITEKILRSRVTYASAVTEKQDNKLRQEQTQSNQMVPGAIPQMTKTTIDIS